MTKEILEWLDMVARTWLPKPGRVLEVGAYNVNGTPRSVFEPYAESYIGTDMQAGPGVDVVVNNDDLRDKFQYQSFDTVICCEVLEHDSYFGDTLFSMKQHLLKPGGHLIISTPTFGFPLHRYPKDYWRFGEDAYREVFFAGMEIIDLRHLNSAAGANTTLAGIARK